MKRLFGLALTALLVTASTAGAQQPPAGGQRAGGPPPMTNLQIFPKDTPREQVLASMQAFTQSLGVPSTANVRTSFCSRRRGCRRGRAFQMRRGHFADGEAASRQTHLR